MIRLSRNGVLTANGGAFDWEDALIDALIMAMITAFSTFAALGATGLMDDPITGVFAAFIAAGVQFFMILAIKRGLVKPDAEN